MDLSIIIVNYKTPVLTAQCIDSIITSKIKLNYEIIVVDNASNDTSKQSLTKDFPNLIWIQNSYNAGFGRANNLGIQKAKGEHTLLVNSDVILTGETITNSLTSLNSVNKAGVLGCQLINIDGSRQKSVWYHIGDFATLWNENIFFSKIYHNSRKEIKAISGAYMLFHTHVLKEIKGFDSDFFMYSEEIELCYRLRQRGYSILYDESINALHLDGASSDSSKWSFRHKHLSNALLYYKLHGIIGYVGFLIFKIFNTVTNTILSPIIDKQYRVNLWRSEIVFYSNFAQYLKIPFQFRANKSNSNRQLKLKK